MPSESTAESPAVAPPAPLVHTSRMFDEETILEPTFQRKGLGANRRLLLKYPARTTFRRTEALRVPSEESKTTPTQRPGGATIGKLNRSVVPTRYAGLPAGRQKGRNEDLD